MRHLCSLATAFQQGALPWSRGRVPAGATRGQDPAKLLLRPGPRRSESGAAAATPLPPPAVPPARRPAAGPRRVLDARLQLSQPPGPWSRFDPPAKGFQTSECVFPCVDVGSALARNGTGLHRAGCRERQPKAWAAAAA
uniref:Uncharacterized protein n=1 Tax=Rangifer tarandus platyrhynchus TaxID=3082113 RepID=A0ACB0DZ84_RANTA|nr:unnamed protein product [Rangifer tarandus platyrhynchus]